MTDAPDQVSQVTKTAAKLLKILKADLKEHLTRVDNYLHGRHDDPYMPDNADDEYKLLAKRAVTNHCPLVVETPAQNLYIDGFRRGNQTAGGPRAGDRRNLPEWVHWENSRLGSRQNAIIRSALTYGHSFAVTELDRKGRAITRGLSPLRTSALFEDPANDDNPVAALHVVSDAEGEERGRAWLADRTNKYELTFDSEGVFTQVGEPKPHGGAGENIVTRFTAAVDLEGRTVGVIEPYLEVQDRINQSVFDLLVVQSGGSFKTRWASGMAPPTQHEPVYQLDADGKIEYDNDDQPIIVDWKPRIDPRTGNPMPAPLNLNAKKFLFAEDDEARFGTLDETPLAPYIESVNLAVKQLSALTRTPPHYLLGQIANLSADALKAAERSLATMVGEFKVTFGESWERIFRIAMKLEGEEGWDDMTGQVLWRDMSAQSMSQVADALGKLADSLGVPKRALWPRVPEISQGELAEWEEMADEEASLGIDRTMQGRALAQMDMDDEEEVVNGDQPADAGGPSGI